MRHVAALVAALLIVTLAAPTVLAFCGFYVAKADTKLFNQASQVVLVRHDDKTVITMANDFKGDPKEFAIVVPVPTVLEKGQVRVSDRALIEHLDAYSAPRLVEYFDDDPCVPLKIPSIHCSWGTLKFTRFAGSELWPRTATIVLLLSRMTSRPWRSGTDT